MDPPQMLAQGLLLLLLLLIFVAAVRARWGGLLDAGAAGDYHILF